MGVTGFLATSEAKVLKVDARLGLVFGYGVVCTEGGQPHYDLQQDHVTERAMLEASCDFMANRRTSGDMHKAEDGTVVFAFPLTADIAKALDINVTKTGLLIGMRPSPEVFAKFADGTYTGFSIGGARVEDEVGGRRIKHSEARA